jgi:N-acetylneuraminic acid mutarotase
MKTKTTLLFTLLLTLSNFLSKADWGWVQKSGFPGTPRHRACAFAIGEKGYIGLGHINSGSLSIAYDDWWEYDPATNSWTQKANYPAGPRFGNFCFGFDNCAYVGGGAIQSWGAAYEFFKFDPVSNTWTYIGNSPVGGEGKPSFVVGDSGYVAGMGFNRVNNTWFGAPQANVGYWDYVFVINNKAYFNQGGNMIEFDPRTNSVVGKGSCPNSHWYPTSFSVNQKGYVIMGTDYTTEFRDQYEYDPITNKWDTLGSFPGSGRHYSPTFVIADKAYMGTGSNGTNMADFWEYAWRNNSSSSVGEESVTLKTNIKIFPTIFNASLSLQNNANNNIEISLIDLNGRIVSTEKMAPHSNAIFETANLSAGSYVVIMKDLQTGQIAHQTILKQ